MHTTILITRQQHCFGLGARFQGSHCIAVDGEGTPRNAHRMRSTNVFFGVPLFFNELKPHAVSYTKGTKRNDVCPCLTQRKPFYWTSFPMSPHPTLLPHPFSARSSDQVYHRPGCTSGYVPFFALRRRFPMQF